ncbi:DNA binding protein [Fragilaria crotonensis]|nr:DNA binding protein [Fragilaria crotonensis]
MEMVSSDAYTVNREIRKHFEYMDEMKRNMAKREREKRKPKRPLSAYNLFFKSEREKLVQEKRRVGFSDMAKEISAKWNALDKKDRKPFDEEALNEKRRYKVALSQWKAQGKLESRKSIAYHGQHIMSLGDHMPAFTSLVDQNEPDPNLLLDLLVQQRVAEEQRMKQPQFHLPGPRHLVQQRVMEEQQMKQPQFQEFQRSAPFAGPRRMSMPSVSTSTVGGSVESCKTATLPMSLQGIMEHHFSMMAKTTTSYHQGGKVSSSPPLPSFKADDYDPDDFLEPIAFGDSGDDDASVASETTNAFMSMPFSDIDSSDDESDESFDAVISRVLEPLPMRRSSLLCLPNNKQAFEGVQNRRSHSMPICRVAEMNELQGVMHLLEREIGPGAESNFFSPYDAEF